MEAPQCILILDFGGQYTQLIARRVRERGVYSCVLPCSAQLADIRAVQPMGIIFSGGPASVLDEGAPRVDEGVFELGVPVLGICYGMQLMAHLLDAPVERGTRREYGRTDVTMDRVDGGLLAGLRPQSPCWMSHTYQVARPPEGFMAIAHTADCPVAAMADDAHRLYGVQFHPEVTHTEEGARVLENFLFGICGCKGDWSMDAYADMAVEQQPVRHILMALFHAPGMAGGRILDVGHIKTGQYLYHTGQGGSGSCIYRLDPAVGNGAVENLRLQHRTGAEIVGIFGAAGHLVGGVHAGDAPPDFHKTHLLLFMPPVYRTGQEKESPIFPRAAFH